MSRRGGVSPLEPRSLKWPNFEATAKAWLADEASKALLANTALVEWESDECVCTTLTRKVSAGPSQTRSRCAPRPMAPGAAGCPPKSHGVGVKQPRNASGNLLSSQLEPST